MGPEQGIGISCYIRRDTPNSRKGTCIANGIPIAIPDSVPPYKEWPKSSEKQGEHYR